MAFISGMLKRNLWRQRDMALGYNNMAELNLALAEEDMEAVNEVWAPYD